jgi:hypothetical protein
MFPVKKRSHEELGLFIPDYIGTWGIRGLCIPVKRKPMDNRSIILQQDIGGIPFQQGLLAGYYNGSVP